MTDEDDKLFCVEDPRKIIITLRTDQYNKHIITGHTEMLKRVDVIEESVKNPESIHCDKKHKMREVYVLQHKDKSAKKFGKLIKTVVDINGYEGDVVTAHFTNSKESGAVRWKK